MGKVKVAKTELIKVLRKANRISVDFDRINTKKQIIKNINIAKIDDLSDLAPLLECYELRKLFIEKYELIPDHFEELIQANNILDLKEIDIEELFQYLKPLKNKDKKNTLESLMEQLSKLSSGKTKSFSICAKKALYDIVKTLSNGQKRELLDAAQTNGLTDFIKIIEYTLKYIKFADKPREYLQTGVLFQNFRIRTDLQKPSTSVEEYIKALAISKLNLGRRKRKLLKQQSLKDWDIDNIFYVLNRMGKRQSIKCFEDILPIIADKIDIKKTECLHFFMNFNKEQIEYIINKYMEEYPQLAAQAIQMLSPKKRFKYLKALAKGPKDDTKKKDRIDALLSVASNSIDDFTKKKILRKSKFYDVFHTELHSPIRISDTLKETNYIPNFENIAKIATTFTDDSSRDEIIKKYFLGRRYRGWNEFANEQYKQALFDILCSYKTDTSRNAQIKKIQGYLHDFSSVTVKINRQTLYAWSKLDTSDNSFFAAKLIDAYSRLSVDKYTEVLSLINLLPENKKLLSLKTELKNKLTTHKNIITQAQEALDEVKKLPPAQQNELKDEVEALNAALKQSDYGKIIDAINTLKEKQEELASNKPVKNSSENQSKSPAQPGTNGQIQPTNNSQTLDTDILSFFQGIDLSKLTMDNVRPLAILYACVEFLKQNHQLANQLAAQQLGMPIPDFLMQPIEFTPPQPISQYPNVPPLPIIRNAPRSEFNIERNKTFFQAYESDILIKINESIGDGTLPISKEQVLRYLNDPKLQQELLHTEYNVESWVSTICKYIDAKRGVGLGR